MNAEDENLFNVGGAARTGDQRDFAALVRVAHFRFDFRKRRGEVFAKLTSTGDDEANRNEVAKETVERGARFDGGGSRVREQKERGNETGGERLTLFRVGVGGIFRFSPFYPNFRVRKNNATERL